MPDYGRRLHAPFYVRLLGAARRERCFEPAFFEMLEQRAIGTPGPAAEATAQVPPGGLEEAFQMIDYDRALAQANERKDNALAAADVALRRAAVNKALDAQLDAQRTRVEAPPGTSPSELAALQAAA